MRFLLAALAFALPAVADTIEVDVELALMVDVSRSMDPVELELQRRGYAEAIRSDQVVGVILGSYTGRIALTYVEWAGNGLQRIVVPWTMIDSREDAEAVAERLTSKFDYSMRRTSISGALLFATDDIARNDFDGLRRVIDVSGDGPNNDGRPVELARDAAIEAGLVINGLPIMVDGGLSPWGIPDLDVYYERCVIGGPGAFSIPVFSWDDFPLAVRRKLVLELAQAQILPEIGGRTERAPYDCLIGEKRRRERELIYGEP